MLSPAITKNDRLATILIGIVSTIVFLAVVVLGKVELQVDLGFNVHWFATANAIINSLVAILLVAALVMVKQRQFVLHRNLMMAAMVLSVLFLVSYIIHHLLSGSTMFGDVDHNHLLDEAEKATIGGMRWVYLVLLLTHIVLAAIVLPIILFTAYRGLTAEFAAHRKLARWSWPIWFYVSVTGPIVYVMISRYYE